MLKKRQCEFNLARVRALLVLVPVLVLARIETTRAVDAIVPSPSTPSKTTAILEQLESIRDGYSANQERLKSVRFRGHIQPGNRHFVLTRKDGKSRFEMDFDQDGTRITCYRLDNGEALFKLDGSSLIIDSLDRRAYKWYSLCNDVSLSEAPLYEEERMNVSERAQWLIDMIRGDLSKKYPTITVDTKGMVESGAIIVAVRNLDTGEREVTLSSKESPVPISMRMCVDPKQGYCLRRWEHFDGASNPAQWRYKFLVENTIQKADRGVFVISKSIRSTTESGAAPQIEKRAGTTTAEFAIDSIEVNNIQVAEDYFSMQSLQLPTNCRH